MPHSFDQHDNRSELSTQGTSTPGPVLPTGIKDVSGSDHEPHHGEPQRSLTQSPEKAEGVRSPSRRKEAAYRNIADWVEYAYSRKGQPVPLKKSGAIELASAGVPDQEFWERLPTIAAQDVLLAVPRQILLAMTPYRHITTLWSLAQRICLLALGAHPTAELLGQAIRDPADDRMTITSLIDAAAALESRQLRDPKKKTPLRKGQVELLRTNAVHTVVLWLVLVRNESQTEVINALFHCIWDKRGRSVRSSQERWRLIGEAKSPEAIGIVCQQYLTHAKEQQDEANRASNAQSKAEQSLQLTAAALEDAQETVRQKEQRIRELLDECSLAKQEHDAAVMHMRDEFERLRTRAVRRLHRELELLQEGMLALQRDPPRVHIMQDHGERAIEGLRQELRALEEVKR
jgi:hypothetical protein